MKLSTALASIDNNFGSLNYSMMLSALGDVDVINWDPKLSRNKVPERAILLGESLTTENVYRALYDYPINHVVQSTRSDAAFELILSALLTRQPEEMIKPENTFLLKKFNVDDKQTIKRLAIQFKSTKDKKATMDEVVAFLQSDKRLINLQSMIMQIADELFMNALFNGPVDDKGIRIFYNTPRHEHVSYNVAEQRALLRVIHSESRLIIGCEDPFGSLDESHVRKLLARVTMSKYLPEVSSGAGAGLGLKMVIENSSALYIFVKKNRLTAVYCALDLSFSQRMIIETPKHAHLVVI